MRLDVTAVPVAPLVGEVVELYENVAEDRHIERVDRRVEAGLTVLADSSVFVRCWPICVDNAIKYTPSGGRVEVSARREGSVVRFDVTDTALGSRRTISRTSGIGSIAAIRVVQSVGSDLV